MSGGSPGGFGGPPGPPPGGYGGYQPPAFGNPYGQAAPPPQPNNTGLFVGLGLGCLVLAAGGIGGAWYVIGSTRSRAAPASPAPAPVPNPAPVPVSPALPSPRAAVSVGLRESRFFRSGTLTTLYVVGELVNQGPTPVTSPGAKIVLYDKAKTAIDETSCYAPGVKLLVQDETVPCFALFPKAKDFEFHKIEGTGFPPYADFQPAKLDLTGVNAAEPAGPYQPHKITGTVTNASSFTAKSVWLNVGLYDADGKIAGAGFAPVPGNDLAPSAAAEFTVNIYYVAKPVVRFVAKAYGYDK